MRKKAEDGLSDCQAGYRSNRGTTDMLFVLQIMIEKIRNSNQEAFITFIDYSKAFDNVIHQHLFETILQMGFPRHLVSLIAGLYQDQKATIRWNGDHCEYFDIKKGVRQVCILSLPSLHLLHRNGHERIGYRWHGYQNGGSNITNLRYADDTALLADNITSMRKLSWYYWQQCRFKTKCQKKQRNAHYRARKSMFSKNKNKWKT